MKQRLKDGGLADMASPDDGDALALTFAAPIVAQLRKRHQQSRRERFGARPRSVGGDGLGWMH